MRSDRAIQFACLAGQRFGEQLGPPLFFRLANYLGLLERAGCRQNSQSTREKKIAGIAIGNVLDIASL